MRRCLMWGDRYSLTVVFRICQIWFSLGAERAVNEALASTFRDVPSYRFLCLVHQIASRMSAAKTGPLVASGFQVCRSTT